MLNNQVKGEIIEEAGKWDNHTMMTQVYDGTYVLYFQGQEEGQYDVDIS